jgi:arylsulfatase A-like enzyme
MDLKDAYAIRIKLVDMYLRDFFSFLKEENLYNDAMIVLTSDHGESFGERHNNGLTQSFFHALKPAYDQEIHVPLIIKLPAELQGTSQAIEDDVRLLDVAPTILQALGINPNSQFRGRSILPGFEPAPDHKYPFVYATWSKPGGAIREDNKKYIYIHHDVGGREEFYDLKNDPGENDNLASSEPEAMLELRRKYNDFVAEIGAGSVTLKDSVTDVPDELREKLEKLGYLNK